MPSIPGSKWKWCEFRLSGRVTPWHFRRWSGRLQRAGSSEDRVLVPVDIGWYVLIPVDMWDICGIFTGEFHTYINLILMGSIRILITITSSGSSPGHFKHPHPNGPQICGFLSPIQPWLSGWLIFGGKNRHLTWLLNDSDTLHHLEFMG